MSLPVTSGQRFGYDADGTLGRIVTATAGVSSLTTAQLVAMNNESDDAGPAISTDQYPALIFPDHRYIYAVYVRATVPSSSTAVNIAVEYSTNTTNGHDGTWQDLVVTPLHKSTTVPNSYRTGVTALANPVKVKGLRLRRTDLSWTLRGFHVYGANYEATLALGSDRYLGDMPSYGVKTVPSISIANRTSSDMVVHLTTEALTDVSPSFAALWYFSYDGLSWYGSLDVTVPANSAEHVTLLCALPSNAVNTVCAARVRATASGQRPYFTYLYMDSITSSNVGAQGVFAQINPDTEVSAVTTPITATVVGAGPSQAARNTVLRYTGTSDNGAISAWNEVVASAQAYTASREISDLVCDPEHQEIVFTLPAHASGTAGTMQLYYNGGGTFVADSGTSLTATVPDPIGAGGAGNATEAYGMVAARVRPIPVPWPAQADWDDVPGVIPSPHPEWMVLDTPAPYIAVGGAPRRPPALGALSRSVAYCKSWSPTAGLQDALELGDLGADGRWLPDTADFSNPSAGSWSWAPHFGGAAAITGPASTASPQPYVDPGYDYYAGGGAKKYTQALIFADGSYGQMGFPANQAAFTLFLVAILHLNPNNSWYDVLASPSAATDPFRATDTAIRHTNGSIGAFIGPKMAEHEAHPTTYKGRLRPVIIGWRESATAGAGRLLVLDALGYHNQPYRYKRATGFDARFFLGINGASQDPAYAALMDVMDIAWWGHAVDDHTFSHVATKLNSAYGVSGR